MMGTISKGINEVISEVKVDDYQWYLILTNEQSGHKEWADEYRKTCGYPADADAGKAYHKVHMLLFQLEKLYDMATELEDNGTVLK